MKRIMLLGGNGLIGRHLMSTLSDYEWITVGRHPTSNHFWSIDSPFPSHLLDRVDHVINLIGVPIMDQRWTSQRWVELKYSRVQSTQGVVDGIIQAALGRDIHVLNASAIGYYEWDVPVTEASLAGTHPIASLVQQWERPLTMGGPFIETRLRFGIILASDGGAFPQLNQLAKWGLGGQQGSGQQWVSWVHIQDVVAAIDHCLKNGVTGPVNIVTPHPVTNATWMTHIRNGVGMRWGLPAPAWGMQLALGQRADMILRGHHVSPLRLLETGFNYQFLMSDDAIRDVGGVGNGDATG